MQTMLEKALQAKKNAYAPYSKYLVGACVLAEDDTLYVGCNVENAAFGVTICAEVNAIGAMIAAGRKRIKSILVVGTGKELCTPCGRCRQFMREFIADDAPVYLCANDKVVETANIEELLPKSFGPEHLKNIGE